MWREFITNIWFNSFTCRVQKDQPSACEVQELEPLYVLSILWHPSDHKLAPSPYAGQMVALLHFDSARPLSEETVVMGAGRGWRAGRHEASSSTGEVWPDWAAPQRSFARARQGVSSCCLPISMRRCCFPHPWHLSLLRTNVVNNVK